MACSSTPGCLAKQKSEVVVVYEKKTRVFLERANARRFIKIHIIPLSKGSRGKGVSFKRKVFLSVLN